MRFLLALLLLFSATLTHVSRLASVRILVDLL